MTAPDRGPPPMVPSADALEAAYQFIRRGSGVIDLALAFDRHRTAGVEVERERSLQPGDAERLARLRKQRDDAPIRYQDGVALAPMTNFQWIEVDFLFQQLDAAQSALAESRAEVARLNAAIAAQQSNQALDELAAETERLGLYPRQGTPP